MRMPYAASLKMISVISCCDRVYVSIIGARHHKFAKQVLLWICRLCV